MDDSFPFFWVIGRVLTTPEQIMEWAAKLFQEGIDFRTTRERAYFPSLEHAERAAAIGKRASLIFV